LGLIKNHLFEHIHFSGMVDTVVELHGDRELHRLVSRFFDKAVYYTVCGFEHAADWQCQSTTVKRAA